MKRFAGLLFGSFRFGFRFARAAEEARRGDELRLRHGAQQRCMSIWGADQDIGKGIADLLVDKLVNDGQYSVIERKALDKILAEQNFSNSDRADPSSAAKIGKILGVDAIIIGSITQFGRDDKKTGVGGGAFGGFGRKVGVGGFEKRESKAVVAITARMINTETAEILASWLPARASPRAAARRCSVRAQAAVRAAARASICAAAISARPFWAKRCMRRWTTWPSSWMQRRRYLPARVITIDGLVADASRRHASSSTWARGPGVKVGDRLEVRRKIREIKDPEHRQSDQARGR